MIRWTTIFIYNRNMRCSKRSNDFTLRWIKDEGQRALTDKVQRKRIRRAERASLSYSTILGIGKAPSILCCARLFSGVSGSRNRTLVCLTCRTSTVLRPSLLLSRSRRGTRRTRLRYHSQPTICHRQCHSRYSQVNTSH